MSIRGRRLKEWLFDSKNWPFRCFVEWGKTLITLIACQFALGILQYLATWIFLPFYYPLYHAVFFAVGQIFFPRRSSVKYVVADRNDGKSPFRCWFWREGILTLGAVLLTTGNSILRNIGNTENPYVLVRALQLAVWQIPVFVLVYFPRTYFHIRREIRQAEENEKRSQLCRDDEH